MRIRFPLLVSLAAFMITTASFGSGFALFEAGAKAVAMGGAFAATADDPSAIWYNVAGIAQQRRGELLIGGTAITFQNSLAADSCRKELRGGYPSCSSRDDSLQAGTRTCSSSFAGG